METKLKSCMPILDEDGRVVGALHIHDLVRAGIGDFPDFLKS
jgi:CBS domain-containing protein